MKVQRHHVVNVATGKHVAGPLPYPLWSWDDENDERYGMSAVEAQADAETRNFRAQRLGIAARYEARPLTAADCWP